MNEVAIQNGSKQVAFTQDQIQVIKNQIAKDATDDELKSFMWQCQRTGLDPFTRQIYFIKEKGGRAMVQTSIDGFRVIAERSKMYEGQTSPQWCGPDGAWKDIWLNKEFPVASRVGVYKKGFREALYAIAHWNEYFAQPTFMHRKMPALMLAKVAESLALRKAFPNEMSGIYTQEEMTESAPEEVTQSTPQTEQGSYGNGLRVAPEQPSMDEGNPSAVHGYTVPFGKFAKRSLEEIPLEQLRNYAEWLEANAVKTSRPLGSMQVEFINKVSEFISSFENSDPNHESDISF
jgi:phage recombination protein Bet